MQTLKQMGFWLQDNWMLVVPVGVGFAALWALLPQGRRRPTLALAAVAAASGGVIGLTMLRATGGELHDLLFCLFAGLAVLAGACMILQRNPVFAALWFAIVVLSTSGLFLLRAAPFLAAAAVIIYAGAIVVTFLFVIMLAQQSGLAAYDRRSREPLLACLAGFLLLSALFFVLNGARTSPGVAMPLADRARQSRAHWGPVLEQLDITRRLVDCRAAANELRGTMRVGAQGRSLADVLDEGTQDPALHEKQKQLFANWSNALVAQPPDYAALAEALAGLRQVVEDSLAREAGTELSLVSPASRGGHVRGLGRSLFGDYLYAVEMAAMLLLVATIGAILIAVRRKEEAA